MRAPTPTEIIKTDEDCRISSWYEPTELEKRQAVDASSQGAEKDYINAGIYLFERAFIESISNDRPVSIEREIFPAAISKKRQIFATAPDGGWLDIGSPAQYLMASGLLITGRIATDLPIVPLHQARSLPTMPTSSNPRWEKPQRLERAAAYRGV